MKRTVTIFGTFIFISTIAVFSFNTAKTPSKNNEGIIEQRSSVVRDSLMNVGGNLLSSGVRPIENKP